MKTLKSILVAIKELEAGEATAAPEATEGSSILKGLGRLRQSWKAMTVVELYAHPISRQATPGADCSTTQITMAR